MNQEKELELKYLENQAEWLINNDYSLNGERALNQIENQIKSIRDELM